MRESKQLEYKESVSNSFLKTVSAYANFGTGKIVFGVADNGVVMGIENPRKICLDIENRINDGIVPVPEYTLQINERTSVITLTVFEGLYKPYLYKSKAYRRSDSATIAADRLELGRLILEGQNLSFEELPAQSEALSFRTLEEKLKASLRLREVTLDTLKTLELYKDGAGFNRAGELLADANGFCGIDMVRFGNSISPAHSKIASSHAAFGVTPKYAHPAAAARIARTPGAASRQLASQPNSVERSAASTITAGIGFSAVTVNFSYRYRCRAALTSNSRFSSSASPPVTARHWSSANRRIRSSSAEATIRRCFSSRQRSPNSAGSDASDAQGSSAICPIMSRNAPQSATHSRSGSTPFTRRRGDGTSAEIQSASVFIAPPSHLNISCKFAV